MDGHYRASLGDDYTACDRADLHRTYVGSVERGERNVTFTSLDRLLYPLEVSWSDFGKRLDVAGITLRRPARLRKAQTR